jgi:hypothetical protein
VSTIINRYDMTYSTGLRETNGGVFPRPVYVSLLLLCVLIAGFHSTAYAQIPISTTCNNATGICTGSTYSFPAATGSGTAQAGASYGCLTRQPNPAWFFLQIQNPGSISITMSSSPARDIDFIIWGPFADPFSQCVTGLTAGKIVDCSYSTAASEIADIPNGQAGEYYVLLITNYSNQNTNITFSQTGGTGTSNCDILCNITSLTATAGACATGANTGKYAVTGTVTSFTPPTTGTLTISSSCGSSVTYNAPFANSINYTLPFVTGEGGTCTITAQYSAVPTCSRTRTVTAPSCCTITPGANVTVCAGQTINLSATGTNGGSYFWSGPNGFTSTARTPSISNATAAHAGAYNVYLVNGSCTTSVATVTVTVKALPNATVTAGGPLAICQNDTATLSVAAGTGLTYQWRRNGTNLTGANSPVYYATQAGNYTVVVSQTGCTPGSATSGISTVTVNALPTATATAGGATTFCPGDSVLISANTGTGLTYQWLINGAAIPSATASSYRAKAAGSYQVTVTNANNCSRTSSAVTVIVNAAPPAVINPADSATFCPGSTVTLSANTGAGLSYQWRMNGSVITGTASSRSVSTAGSYVVTVTNNSSGCKTSSAATIVTQSAAATANITVTGPPTFCDGDSVVLDANAGSGFTYQWQRNGSNLPGETDLRYVARTAGNFRVIVTQSGCTPPSATSSVVAVTVKPLPPATITASDSSRICSGDSVLFTANTGTGLTYQWHRDGVNTGPGTSQLRAVASGNYSVTVTLSGCAVLSSSKHVTVHPLPTVHTDTSGPAAFCTGDSVLLTAVSGTGLTYAWIRNGHTIPGATGNTYTATSGGTYVVAVTDNNGCKASAPEVDITAYPYPPAAITAMGSATFCQGDSVELDANKDAGLSYQWQLGGTDIPGATDEIYTTSSGGSYTVIITSNGCATISAPVQVTVNPRPAPGKVIMHR